MPAMDPLSPLCRFLLVSKLEMYLTCNLGPFCEKEEWMAIVPFASQGWDKKYRKVQGPLNRPLLSRGDDPNHSDIVSEGVHEHFIRTRTRRPNYNTHN